MVTIQNEPILESGHGVQLPVVQYHTYVNIAPQTVFTGETIPLPAVLIEYLFNGELKVFLMILREIRNKMYCRLSIKEMAERLHFSMPLVCRCVKQLQAMGLITVTKGKNCQKIINFDVLIRLDSLLKDRDEGTIREARIRFKTHPIMKVTPTMLKWLDNFGGTGDEVEDEAYK